MIDTPDEGFVDVFGVTMSDATPHDVGNALSTMWREAGRPQQFGVILSTEHHRHSFMATPVTRIDNLISIGLTAIGSPRVFKVQLSPTTTVFGGPEQIRHRLRAFALAAIDATLPSWVSCATEVIDEDKLDALIDEFTGSPA